jgi:hypothetical protein
MATSAGRDGGMLRGLQKGLAGVQGGDFKDKGLQGAEPEVVSPQAHGTKPVSKETQAAVGDVDSAKPGGRIEAAKQAQDRDRGSSYTSSSGKPSFIS